MKLGEYPVETLQIYFPASLELQEELINHGFVVPKPTPIPIIYINFKGWISKKPPVTIERLIEPSRYGVNLEEMKWREATVKGRRAYEIPPEESYIDFELIENRKLKIKLHSIKYHLERISIRVIPPRKWTNWAMVYISLKDAEDLKEKLLKAGIRPSIPAKFIKEKQQGGKEKTAYSPVKVYDFKLCLGCFNYAFGYLKLEARKQELNIHTADLKLSLRKGEERSFLKAGVSKMEGKNPQFMMKLASSNKKVIRGILKPIIEGKPRGFLELCDHTKKEQFFIVDVKEFLGVLHFLSNKQLS